MVNAIQISGKWGASKIENTLLDLPGEVVGDSEHLISVQGTAYAIRALVTCGVR